MCPSLLFGLLFGGLERLLRLLLGCLLLLLGLLFGFLGLLFGFLGLLLHLGCLLLVCLLLGSWSSLGSWSGLRRSWRSWSWRSWSCWNFRGWSCRFWSWSCRGCSWGCSCRGWSCRGCRGCSILHELSWHFLEDTRVATVIVGHDDQDAGHTEPCGDNRSDCASPSFCLLT